jgi:hypothetical protein
LSSGRENRLMFEMTWFIKKWKCLASPRRLTHLN